MFVDKHPTYAKFQTFSTIPSVDFGWGFLVVIVAIFVLILTKNNVNSYVCSLILQFKNFDTIETNLRVLIAQMQYVC